MMRISFPVTAAAIALGAVLAFAAPALADGAVSLRSAARVTGTQIKLGDFFDNAGPHADEIVGNAPAPGTTLLFESAWLNTTAHNFGLAWEPPSGETAIRVQRAARTVENAELTRSLMPALGLVPGKTSLQFDTQYRVQVPLGDAAGGDGPGYAVENAQINQAVGRFTAELRIPPGDPSTAPIRIAGRVVTMTDVPVLARPMVPGEQVTKDDIVWAQVPSANLPAGDVSDPQEMIGRTPRHPLQAGQPLRPLDLQVPVVVKRNDAVLIVLERPGLYMTAEGKALEDGGRGAAIRVVNTQSNRTIDAVVLASGQVAVRPPGVQQAAIQ
jgi:flagellar basal body P-ring formation protein FlgA